MSLLAHMTHNRHQVREACDRRLPGLAVERGDAVEGSRHLAVTGCRPAEWPQGKERGPRLLRGSGQCRARAGYAYTGYWRLTVSNEQAVAADLLATM